MDKINEWINMEEAENGLQTWCKIDILDDTKYLKVQYRDSEGNVVDKTYDYPVQQIRILKNLIDRYIYATEYPYIDLNNPRR